MRKVVYISNTNIFDKSGNGGAKASREHYDMLVDLFGEENIKVILFLDASADLNPDIVSRDNFVLFLQPKGDLKRLIAALGCCRVYMPWDEKTILDEIAAFDPMILFLDTSVVGRLVKKKNNKKYKTICFFHNVESDYTLNKIKKGKIEYAPAYFAAMFNDKRAVLADKVLCFNKRDSSRLRQLYGRNADSIIPITFKDRFNMSLCKKCDNKRLLFIGSCFGPNEDGLRWFVNNVMSQFRNIVLDVVGIGFENKREEYSIYPNINIIGAVENTDDYYYSHRAVVMPIRYGSGMKVKTAEAMMFGRLIIASDESLEGYDIDGVEGIFRCNEVNEYVNAIKRTFDDYDEFVVSDDVRKLFLEKYETARIKNVFSNEINDVLNAISY